MSILGAIPATYTQQTSNSRNFLIQKGQLNHYRLRPAILNEHVETARQIQEVVSNTKNVGQIFKASQDNINGIALTLESAPSVQLDDFESYADSAALQAAWVASNVAKLAVLETGIVYEDSKAMEMPGDASVDDEWTLSIDSADFTGYTGSFAIQQSHAYSSLKLRIFIGDGTNTKSSPIVVQDPNAWEIIEVLESSMTEDGGGTTDVSAITKIGFRVEDARQGAAFYIDDIKAAAPDTEVDLELWDLGSELPVDGVTKLNDGTQYEELGDRGVNSGSVVSEVRLDLLGGKRQYFIRPFVAGVALEIPDNTLLNKGNYYAIVVKYVNGDVNVYGSNTSYETVYYNNGFAFSTPDNETAITKLGTYNDLQFIVFSAQDVYINTMVKFYNAAPGLNAAESVYVEDENMNIVGVIANDSGVAQSLQAEFKDRVYRLPKGGKFEINHNDDFTDSTSQISVLLGYIFEPPVING